MAPTAAKFKCETATEDECVDDIKENVATNSAEISTQLSAKAAEICLNAHEVPAAGDGHVEMILKLI